MARLSEEYELQKARCDEAFDKLEKKLKSIKENKEKLMVSCIQLQDNFKKLAVGLNLIRTQIEMVKKQNALRERDTEKITLH